jgi:steroid 5-alpha reductase family enzyme
MCLLLIIATPIYFIFQDEISGNISTILGIIIMIFGVSYEAIADAQLKKYLQTTQEKNKVFTGGLYKYSRHPNYF